MHILGLLCTYIAFFSYAYLCIFLAWLVLHITSHERKAQAENSKPRMLKPNSKTRTAKAQAEKPEPRKLKPN